MNTTLRMKASDIYKDWHVIDAADQPLGRVASEAAILLRGKHKPTYEPHLDDGDFVIIINASKVRVTGRKSSQMMYYRHSGYPGGLKKRTYPQQLARFPDRVLERAIKGMLPGGTLGESMAKHLKVYARANHPHQSQVAGSANAKAARDAAAAAHIIEPMKAPRLRPLSIPQGSEPPVAVMAAAVEAVVEAVAEAPKAPRRTKKTEEPAAEAAAVEATPDAAASGAAEDAATETEE